jgi:hypothetical protein
MSDALGELGLLHNFTIESQVQFHAPLAFEPSKRNISGQDVYVLDQDQLKVFINSAEWTLCMYLLYTMLSPYSALISYKLLASQTTQFFTSSYLSHPYLGALSLFYLMMVGLHPCVSKAVFINKLVSSPQNLFLIRTLLFSHNGEA